MNKRIWFDINKTRYDWAKTAHTDFMRNVDKQYYQSTETKEQIYIAIYGPSQVGKTSLLLELLGVSSEYYSTVEEALRGKQIYGNSATATVIRYKVSNDNHWEILSRNKDLYFKSEDNAIHSEDEQVASMLSQIRSEMHLKGRYFHIDEIQLSIPMRYINKNKLTNKDVIIYDLPGVHAKNKNERDFVSKIIKDRLIFSDMVLMVTTIDNMGKIIHKENLIFDELHNWHLNPIKFKVIFTRFYSDYSSIEKCKKIFEYKNKITQPDIRSYINNEINTHDNEWNVMEQIYALDVGKSWQSMINKRYDNEFLDAVVKSREDFFKDLVETINSSSSPIARLCFGYQVGAIAKKLKEERKINDDVIISSIEKQIVTLNDYIITYENKIESLKTSILNIKTNKEDLQRLLYNLLSNSKNDIDNIYEEFEKSICNLDNNKNSATNIKKILKEVNISLKYEYLHISLELTEYFDLDEFPESNKLKIIYHKINSYKLQKYLLINNFKKDINQSIDAVKDQVNLIYNTLTQKQQIYMDKLETSIEKNIKMHNIEILNYSKKIEDLNTFVFEKKEEIEKIKNLSDIFNMEREHEIEISEKFSSFVEYYFRERNEFIFSSYQKSSSNIEKLCWVLLMHITRKDFGEVMGKGDINHE